MAPVGTKFNPKRPVAIRCIDNSKCAAAGLNGDCCPTPGPLGQTLACCTAEDNFITATLTAPGACDDNSACTSMGLTGACCPTANGVSLACCFSQNNTVRLDLPTLKPCRSYEAVSQARSQHPVSAQCAKNPACRRLKLDGNCCPNDAGATLGCCPPTTSVAKPQSGPRSVPRGL